MKVLVVGLGSIGQRHVRNLRALLGTSVDILAYRTRRLSPIVGDDLTIAANEDLEGKYGIRAFGDLDEALDQGPEVVFVCNPTSLHLPVAARAARAGCHLFLEKPISHTFEGVDELINIVNSHGLVAAVGCQLRFHPCLRRLRTLLSERAIGNIISARAECGEYLPAWHPYEDYRSSFAARADLGGGVLLTQVHEFDYLLWLFGMPQRLFAVGGHLSSLEIDVEDTATVLMDIVVENRSIPVYVHHDFLQMPFRRSCAVVGDQGQITIDLRRGVLEWTGADGAVRAREAVPEFDRNWLFLEEMEQFLRSIRGTEEPAVSLADGARALAIAVAAKESIRTGATVDPRTILPEGLR